MTLLWQNSHKLMEREYANCVDNLKGYFFNSPSIFSTEKKTNVVYKDAPFLKVLFMRDPLVQG